MKRIVLIVAGFCLLMSLSSCLTTLYPFFTEKDVVFDPTLIGDWKYENKDERGFVEFESIPATRRAELEGDIRKLADKGYFVTWKDSTRLPTKCYFVFLARIGDYYYLDHFPAEVSYQMSIAEVFRQHYLKLHRCYRVTVHNKDNIELKLLDGSFLNELIKKKQIRMHYENLSPPDNKGEIITSSTEELQQFLLKYGGNAKAYNDRFSFTCTRIINY